MKYYTFEINCFFPSLDRFFPCCRKKIPPPISPAKCVSTTHRSHITHPAAQIISQMSGRGRGRTGRPPLVAPNGHAARRRNDETSLTRVAVSGRDGRGD